MSISRMELNEQIFINMETHTNYKGFGITYFINTGVTYVIGYRGNVIKIFKFESELIGVQKAKQFIDNLLD